MGLKEKRLINVVKDENIPSHQFMLKEQFGIEMAFDLDWDEWTDGYDAVLNLNGYVLGQAVDGIAKVARDSEGKEAIREQVKTIRVRRNDDPAQKSIGLEGGHLALVVAPAEGWEGVFSGAAVAEYLTEHL